MEKAKKFLFDMKQTIADKLHDGFSASELPSIADAIHDIEVIENYLALNYSEIDYSDIDAASWLLANIKDELKAAEKYYSKFTRTKDHIYKTMAREELRHAEQLTKIAKTKIDTPEKNVQLQELVGWYQQLLSKV